jgi:hypothetical protein
MQCTLLCARAVIDVITTTSYIRVLAARAAHLTNYIISAGKSVSMACGNSASQVVQSLTLLYY